MTDVLLVDDEELVRFGLRAIVESAPGLRIVAEASDGAEAVRLARELRPDVILMDIRMPGMDGLAAAEELSADPDPPKVIILTTFDLDDHVLQALENGAVGFLLKDTPPKEIIAAITTVAEGNAILSPGVTRQLIDRFADRPGGAGPGREAVERLTEREREVVTLMAEGLSNAGIGTALAMSEATVKVHVSHVLTKLGAANRVQAAIIAYRAGLTSEK
ncbi:response regulator transcription factor [Actinocorallia longicatena]|uniref:Response regulator transcription factor n=1 Tax=Actinocorallia longicatena TaxID=111803 RepID=A0ABP6QH64_9ACTN